MVIVTWGEKHLRATIDLNALAFPSALDCPPELIPTPIATGDNKKKVQIIIWFYPTGMKNATSLTFHERLCRNTDVICQGTFLKWLVDWLAI